MNFSRHLSRFLFDYAASPSDFSIRIDNTIKQLYYSNGKICNDWKDFMGSVESFSVNTSLFFVSPVFFAKLDLLWIFLWIYGLFMDLFRGCIYQLISEKYNSEKDS